MATLFQNIVNEAIREGGNAILSAQDVRGDIAGEIAKDVIQAVSNAFGCHAEPAGSTGKKGHEMYSGDIDILMDMPWEEENIKKVTEWVKESFPTSEIKPTNGFKEISFGYPYTDEGEEKIAQVDLMFTGNINWRRWSAYSPSPYDEEYAEHGVEKAFKGLVQTVLLKAIASAKPLNINELPEEYQTMDFSSVPFTEAEAQQIMSRRASRGREDADRLGKNKSYWRYMWDAETGLMIVRKSFEGARGMLIDPKIQERVGPITSNVDEGLKLILGPAATTEVLKNPITLVKYLFSGNYPYSTPENLRRIHNVVVNNDQIKEMPGVVENFDKVWNTYANSAEKQQGEPAYSASLNENKFSKKMRELIKRMK
jgi:hypothetical protein